MDRRLAPLSPLLSLALRISGWVALAGSVGCSPWYGLRVDLVDDGVETVVGANLTPVDLGTLPREDVFGLSVGPFHSDVRSVTGVQVAGLLARADASTGIRAGLMVGSGGDVDGVTVAPLVFTPYRHTDLEGEFDGAARGVQIAGLVVDFPHQTGLSLSSIVRARTLTGLAIGGVLTDVRDRAVGVTVGLVNRADRLKGVQIGLLNRVAERPAWRRWMPFVNVGWDAAADAAEAAALSTNNR